MVGLRSGKRERFDPYNPSNLDIKFVSLNKMYEASKKAFWNDTTVIDDLIRKHGGIKLAKKERQALRDIFSIIYYGEIVALEVSAQLLPKVGHLDAKKVLAAQTMEEAKHVTAMQRYLKELGEGIPKINKYAKKVLEDVRREKSFIIKLTGMQLLVESLAHHLFMQVRKHVDEPVLKDLLRYIDIDETKHVGLARNYLPVYLEKISYPEAVRLIAKQQRWIFWLLRATFQLKHCADVLGIDVNEATKKSVADNTATIRKIGRTFWDRKGLLVLPEWFTNLAIDLMFPPGKRSRLDVALSSLSEIRRAASNGGLSRTKRVEMEEEIAETSPSVDMVH